MIVREKILELVVELGGKGLVVRQNKGRALNVLNNVCDREGLARTGDPEKGLELLAVEKTVGQLFDRFRLGTFRRIGGLKRELIRHIQKSSKSASSSSGTRNAVL